MGTGFYVADNNLLKIPTRYTSVIEEDIIALILQVFIDRQGSVNVCPPITDKNGLLNTCHI
jgi:hypothetical protein